MRRPAAIVLIWGAGFLLPIPVSATTIHVPADQPTIQAGINAAVNGDTVLVAPGTYAVNLTVLDKEVHVVSIGGYRAAFLIPMDTSKSVVTIGGGLPLQPELVGFSITGSQAPWPILILGNVVPRIRENFIYDNGWVPGATQEMISCQGPAVIERNLFYFNGGISCVGIRHAAARIINNTFDSNGRGYFTIVSGGIAKNNIVVNSLEYGVYGSFTVSDYNDVWNNGPNYSGGATPGAHDLSADPLFADRFTRDYGLQPGSPCINAGDPDPIYNDPDGTRNDLGAFPSFVQPFGVAALRVGSIDENPSNLIDHTPEISWLYVDSSGRPYLGASVQVGDDNDWTLAERWNVPIVPAPDTSLVYAGLELVDGATYWIRIRVLNDSAWSGWRQSAFHMNSLPTAPPLISPIWSRVSGTNPTLAVGASIDAEFDALSYFFEVYADSVLSSLVEAGTSSDLNWEIMNSLSENQLRWWRSRAFDGYEYGSWSLTGHFWFDDYETVPTAPSLRWPPNWGLVCDPTPDFEWGPSYDPDPHDPLTYTLTVSTDSNLISRADVGGLIDTTYHWGSNLAMIPYWWQVSTIDSHGSLNASPVLRFTVGDCPCHADPQCDGSIDVLDVVKNVDVAFRGGVPLYDGSCPVYGAGVDGRTDVNCDGATDVLDVVAEVDVAFRSADPATKFCEPCGM